MEAAQGTEGQGEGGGVLPGRGEGARGAKAGPGEALRS